MANGGKTFGVKEVLGQARPAEEGRHGAPTAGEEELESVLISGMTAMGGGDIEYLYHVEIQHRSTPQKLKQTFPQCCHAASRSFYGYGATINKTE